VVLRSYDLDAIASLLEGRGAALDSSSSERQAAVAAILRAPPDPGDAEILLVRRAERAGDPWSGHMAFPGGRREEGDASLLTTAIRETREEVGLDLEAHGALLARLPDTPAVARGLRVGMVIAPFVFALRSAPRHRHELRLNDEIAEAIWTPLGPLARGESACTHPYVHQGKHIDLPGLRVGERVVWGLTHHMLQALFAALHAR
jgi:8-oxo-dGTP pyrophosphatase MutT (NUDIX family)